MNRFLRGGKQAATNRLSYYTANKKDLVNIKIWNSVLGSSSGEGGFVHTYNMNLLIRGLPKVSLFRKISLILNKTAWDMNPEYTEYEVWVQTIRPRCSIKLSTQHKAAWPDRVLFPRLN